MLRYVDELSSSNMPVPAREVAPDDPFTRTCKRLDGDEVPMPTFTLFVAPCIPLILPRTKLLLAETNALAPIAVALERLSELTSALSPKASHPLGSNPPVHSLAPKLCNLRPAVPAA